MEILKNIWTDEEGQGFAEYALILALVALLVIGALSPLGTAIANIFTKIKNELIPPAATI
ncbi:MAG: Flp family type IVb pilin [Clostridiaceae bacterium]